MTEHRVANPFRESLLPCRGRGAELKVVPLRLRVRKEAARCEIAAKANQRSTCAAQVRGVGTNDSNPGLDGGQQLGASGSAPKTPVPVDGRNSGELDQSLHDR